MSPIDDDLKAAWQGQPSDLPRPLASDWQEQLQEQLRQQALTLQDTVRRRNRLEFVGGAVGIPVFCFYAWWFPSGWTKLGALLTVLGGLWVLWQIHRRGANLSLPVDWSQQGLPFHRAQLQRQRDALHTVWRWYLAPLLPGMAIFIASMHDALGGWWLPSLQGGFTMLVFGWVHWRNRRAAAQLQAEIDALDLLSDTTDQQTP